MNSVLKHLVAFFAISFTTLPAATPQEQAAAALVQRILPAESSRFICETVPPEDGRDVFEIESRDGKVVLRGNNGGSIASALNWYLKYHCHRDVSWCGDQLGLPDPLPVVPEKFRKVSPHTYRYAFNYCTYGYTMAFWDWERWEREIDLMALHGINTPLMATGAEVVYRNVYRDLGMSAKDIDSFIAAPPFLPWFMMGNIDGWGGPNPREWYDRQEALQKRIMARALELGMKPVLPAFGGHVPAAFAQKFPKAKVARLKSWSGFPGVHVLDPADPLFRQIGSRFVKEATKLYGTAHLYSADTFNEVDPPTDDPEYLKGMTRQVYQAMADADPEAVWFMQGWLFVHSKFWTKPRIDALLSGATEEQMVLLDLFADGKSQWKRTDAFAGKPWLWCIINNWGGKQGMYGRLTEVGVKMPELLKSGTAGRLSGIGTLNEGGENNPIVYEQIYEMAWHDQPLDLEAWVEEFAWARYGVKNQNALDAWKLLSSTLYDCRDLRHGPQGNFLAMPPLLAEGGGSFVRGPIFYDTAKIREAFRLLLAAADELGEKDTYRHDLVDVGRQVMSDISQQQLHTELRAAFNAKDKERFKRSSEIYLQAIVDCDRLLSSHRMFQFGRYLKYPASAGGTAATKAQWTRNACRLITLWGGEDNSLFGYAQRQYGGLMRDYNLRTWKLYLDAAAKGLRDGGKMPSGEMVREFTEKWIAEQKQFPVEAEGDTVAAARMIWEKYAAKATAVAGPKAPLQINDRE
ncbi:alpha-N-acetylglucosaminidase [Luteolibacter yonseiensis]|uniref:Alpha-N-acetylglucosaminidase n=1 Tax=Luteolibacter yonseiensis TaxID=1144680 RepID=A0A934R8X1_9BACT|nr:alpha-N-acetylglucosaminidase [Luteolibacter yonseiensis]MBK1818477.1 alpha-N-acetylglucosaminidase [Luteolibacter yonseiensis]